ncbi:MAG TPA: excisionase family DNA-binding protein, partial [Candidatus Acidoferrales bacterium]|nr:excisionase family DNA-binding protein [Candidatus Acidoferrales bacterium]
MNSTTPLRWFLQNQKPALVPQKYYSLRQAGQLVGLGVTQLRRLVKKGVLKSVRLTPRSHFRIPQSEIEKFL